MIDFNALLNQVFEAAIEAKVAPLRAQIENAGHIVVTRKLANGQLAFTSEIKELIDECVKKGHEDEYDHNEFMTGDNIRDKIKDMLSEEFQSMFDNALDGTRVTLNT